MFPISLSTAGNLVNLSVDYKPTKRPERSRRTGREIITHKDALLSIGKQCTVCHSTILLADNLVNPTAELVTGSLDPGREMIKSSSDSQAHK